jgi:hypothetical protein
VQAPPVGQLFHFTVQREGNTVGPQPPAPPRTMAAMTRMLRGAAAPQPLLRGVPLLKQDDGYVVGMVAHYESLSGNLPATYNNNIALWMGTTPNLQKGPLVSGPVTMDAQTGEVLLEWPIQETDYSITYQTGPEITTMCALARVPVSGPLPVPLFATLQIRALTTDTLSIYYAGIPGSSPKNANSWVGLYVGSAVPYGDDNPPLAKVPITLPYPQGPLSVPFTPGFETYTVVFYTGANITNAAAALTFSVTGP